jgi:XTP/dITP diphosphohydrolase/tetrapyrrole methylase family protein/MazG family protein
MVARVSPSVNQVERLREIMARLRAPGGCPWDREQTHATLRPFLIEECCELLDALDREDFPHVLEELGDVLLQVVFHAQLAAEAGRFDLDAVARSISDKLVRRHPHVFGENKLETSGEVLRQWDKIKKEEQAEKGRQPEGPEPLVKPLPPALPALLRACEVHKQLARKGALPRAPGLHDETAVAALAEGLDEAGAGRRLFEIAAACRRAGIDPESALRRHAAAVAEAAEKQRAGAAR